MATALDGGVSPHGYLAVLFDGATVGWKGPVNLSKMDFKMNTRGRLEITIDGKTTGAYTFGAITLPT